MKAQSQRATLLTLLAAFYLPMTLVTGIFGMNIRESSVEGKKPALRHCFFALLAVIGMTFLFYGCHKVWVTFLSGHRPWNFIVRRRQRRLEVWGYNASSMEDESRWDIVARYREQRRERIEKAKTYKWA